MEVGIMGEDLNQRNKEEQATIDRFDSAIVGEAEASDEAVATMSGLGKVINIIIAPTLALRAIKAKPTILWAMIIVPLFSLLYYLLFWDAYEVQMIKLLELQFAAQGMELTREMLDLQLKIQRVVAPVGSFVGTYLGAVIAAFFYFIIGKIMKKEVTFKQTFSLLMHVSIISSLIFVMHMLLTLILGESNIMAPMTSAASLLPSSMDGSLLSYLLIPIEIFTLWYMYVLYLGLNIVCNYSKKAAGITVVVTLMISMLLGASSYIIAALT